MISTFYAYTFQSDIACCTSLKFYLQFTAQDMFLYVCATIFFTIITPMTCADELEYYTAAVLEHVRFGDPQKHSPEEILGTNLNTYKLAIETAAANDVDIIVFPEYGLFPHDKENRSAILPFVENIPNPEKETRNLCNERESFSSSSILATLSCLAKQNNIYIVANMADIKKCFSEDDQACDADQINDCQLHHRKCPSDGMKIHNTNVVFDRKGKLISRYYKAHLYFEPDINPPDNPDNAYFNTDFDVLFTTFVCFDITFEQAVKAVENRHIMNVAYPTYWYDHLPFITAVQFHQAWAIRNNVNLLSSNVHLPGTGTLGSAIYSGTKGALIYTYNPDGRTKLLISTVPKRTDVSDASFVKKSKRFIIENGKVEEISEEVSHFQEQCSRLILGQPKNFLTDYRCFQINITGMTLERIKSVEGSMTTCNNKLCCSLSYQAESMNEEYYLVAYANVDDLYETYGFCTETCLLVRCDSLQGKSCAVYPLKSKTVFSYVELKGNFSSNYVYPSVLKSGMKLASTKEWTTDYNSIIFHSQSADNALLSVNLYGRCYDRDPVFPK